MKRVANDIGGNQLHSSSLNIDNTSYQIKYGNPDQDVEMPREYIQPWDRQLLSAKRLEDLADKIDARQSEFLQLHWEKEFLITCLEEDDFSC